MATKLGQKLTYDEEAPLKKLHDNSIAWFFEVMWHIKRLYPHLH